ncbi:flavin reductase like domain-containing protein [Crassisporium funariophilum]|nr:flavin reductase like domain-containing protein [Crassisporium funariophilum]
MSSRTLSKSLQHVARFARYSTHQNASKDVKDQLRVLLRDVAQPVAVVSSFMPSSSESSKNAFHGATLSSFTSIAMDPYPLVTFALRIPSRMATYLESAPMDSPSHMVINLLSAEQASVAVKFSRPDLHPDPFAEVRYRLTEEGIPMLEGCLGALSCKLVSRAIPLHDLDLLREGPRGKEGRDLPAPVLGKGSVASELFIARVTRVETALCEDGDEGERTLPLVYHRRSYTSCHPRPQSKSKP